MKFQMFKLDLDKAEEPEIKLPISSGSWKKQESSRKTSISALLTMPKPLTVWITTNCGKFLKKWKYLTTYLPPDKSVCRSRSKLELDIAQHTGSKSGKEYVKAVLSPCLFNFYAEYITITSDMQMIPHFWQKARRN